MRYYYPSEERTDERKKEITELGLRYNLLTAYTSFLAVDENEPAMETQPKKGVIRFVPPVLSQSKEESYSMNEISVQECQAVSPRDQAKVFEVVEVMPAFPGGEKALLEYIDQQLVYPLADQEAGIEGRVVLRFRITATGEITDIEVVHSLSPACDKEAIRIVKNMPKWISGKMNGQAVDTFFSLPIRFHLGK